MATNLVNYNCIIIRAEYYKDYVELVFYIRMWLIVFFFYPL